MPQTKTRIVCTQLQISSWFFRNRKPEFKDGSQRTDFAGSLSNGVDDLENFTSEMEWSFLFPSGSPVFFQIGTVTYQHRLRFRWRGFMYEFLPLIRKARTRCDLCRALHDFARLRLTSQCLPAGNYGWRKCIQRGCLKNTSSVSF